MIPQIDHGSKMLRQTRVLLLRHGETAAPHQFHGAESDIGLGPNGHKQAETAALALAARQPIAIYSSTMRRARETAEPIARACQLVTQVVESLHETKMGPLAGLPIAEGLAHYLETARRWMSGEIDYAQPGAESYADVRDRVIPAFQALANRHPGQTIVVVAHGQVIRILITSLVPGFGPADYDAIPINHVAVNDLAHDGQTWRVIALDQTPISEKTDEPM
jgi:broad specificity phosphatase PhoE